MNTPDIITVSDAEMVRRQKAVDYARASLALEGFVISTDEEQRVQAFLSGKLTLAEFISVEIAQ
ncbi:antitoxin VbhA family protein [Pseudomonas caricapapayae]|uniref:antitoxin VbhA family protein n=1 Tax=Pseudomonas caricapapayae TaxID=46678 RepID=UPI000F00CE8C|nr:antitoxin VbhA family protein [Pseudomonas caricapapayae]RMV92661.1 hypothetical protein ALP01_02433 [Pseudomonas caricapapayae]